MGPSVGASIGGVYPTDAGGDRYLRAVVGDAIGLGEVADDPVAAASSPEAIAFSEESVRAWAAAVEASGTATPEELSAAVDMSMAQFGSGAATEGQVCGW